MGAGQNRFFDEHLDRAVDYWVVDNPGFYDAAKYRHSASLRRRTTLVDGLVGNFLPGLPSESFDIIFSISVLEHVPVEHVSKDVCKDMYRLLAPGGRIVHTLDMTPDIYETMERPSLKAWCQQACS